MLLVAADATHPPAVEIDRSLADVSQRDDLGFFVDRRDPDWRIWRSVCVRIGLAVIE